MNRKVKRTILTLTLSALALATIASNRSTKTQAHNLRLRTDTSTVVPPQEGGNVTEEFHQTYPLSATGRVSIENINGPVHITVWDATGVKVDAIKRAYSKERLDEVTIDVTTTADSVRIRTKYPEGNQSFSSKEEGRWNNPASV